MSDLSEYGDMEALIAEGHAARKALLDHKAGRMPHQTATVSIPEDEPAVDWECEGCGEARTHDPAAHTGIPFVIEDADHTQHRYCAARCWPGSPHNRSTP